MPGTLSLFSRTSASIPAATSWYIADLSEFKGKQELFTRQSPQRLRVLREHSIIESAVSSNRMEGVSVDPDRVTELLLSTGPLFRDRDEEEVRGYREALRLLHDGARDLTVSEETILQLHRLTRGEIWDAGQFKDQDGDIIEKYADGRERVRFRTVTARDTPDHVRALVASWHDCLRDRQVHPLIAMALFNLDFLCIHPFRDGNGRVSRLLLLLQCYHLGYEVGRFVSLERLIEENKDRYYETLEQCSTGWHEDRQDPWPYVNYLLFILKKAYTQFAERVGSTEDPRGAKTEQVKLALARMPTEFTIGQLEQACPGVGKDMVRKILREAKGQTVDCIGRGPGALWRKRGNTLE